MKFKHISTLNAEFCAIRVTIGSLVLSLRMMKYPPILRFYSNDVMGLLEGCFFALVTTRLIRCAAPHVY